MNFDDFVQRFDSGEVTADDIRALVEIVHPGDPEAQADRMARLIKDDGTIVKFQAVGLNKQAQTKSREERMESAQPDMIPLPEIIEVPNEFAADIPEEVYDRPDYVPQIKQRVGIVQAVRTWGKPQAQIKDQRTEGVKVRCPFTAHTDKDPSAWVNTNKNTWYCGKCEVGGDVIDFYAAARHDLAPSDFHRSDRFPQIIEEMADELGILIVSTSDGGFTVETDTSAWASNALDSNQSPEPEQPAAPAQIVEQTDEGPLTIEVATPEVVPPSAEASEPVTISTEDITRGIQLDDTIPDDDDDSEGAELADAPTFEWRSLNIPPGTFLHSWMEQAESDFPWVAPEFFLSCGIQGIGIAAEHKTTSVTYGMPLTASTMTVLIGGSGSGKTTAVNQLRRLIGTAVGPKRDNALGTGVKVIEGVSSAEALLGRIRTEIFDINDPQLPPKEVPTNAWYFEDELATFISRARRQGGEHIKQRVMKMHDFTKKDHSRMELAVEDYSQTGGYRSVSDSYFTATFLTQPESLPSLTDKVDLVSGFFNRMNFVMGQPRQKRVFSTSSFVDPDPPYVKLYERMWKDCQLKVRIIAFSDDAAELVRSHPVKDRLETWEQRSPMFARWQITMLRHALIFAINENSPLVEPRHVEAAYRYTANFLTPCAARMVEESSKVEVNIVSELVAVMNDWATRQFDKHGVWPEARKMKSTRWWRESNVDDAVRAKKLASDSRMGVEIELLDGPWGAGKRTVYVVPTGDYSAYESSHGKKFKYGDFYAGRDAR